MNLTPPIPLSPHFAASQLRVTSVMLNYNSLGDLRISAPQLRAQRDIWHALVIVDNASEAANARALVEWVQEWEPNAIVGSSEEVAQYITAQGSDRIRDGSVFLVLNGVNGGYSSGNNIGIRLSLLLATDAVLIANPDMRIGDPAYLGRLCQYMFADPQAFVAASRVNDLNGKNRNPRREPKFFEELLWPLEMLRSRSQSSGYVIAVSDRQPSHVPKVWGCCVLLRASFVRQHGSLDEQVFLYAEEAILAAKVARAGGRILYVPDLVATHAHVRGEKDASARRMTLYITSRLYYLRTYSGYSAWKLRLLEVSYAILLHLHAWRAARKTRSQ